MKHHPSLPASPPRSSPAAAATLAAQNQEGSRFRSGVELINVTATVTDDDGRFVSGLRKEDFTVYEDGNGRRSRTSATSACR